MRPRDANDHSITARHPLDVMNVPNPDDQEVLQFAPTRLAGAADDENAGAWASPSDCNLQDTIDSIGPVDGTAARPTIPGDTESEWKPGRVALRKLRWRNQ